MQLASIDTSGLPPWLVSSMVAEAERYRLREKTKAEWPSLLQEASDAEIMARALLDYPDAPITLANRYETIEWRQDAWIAECGNHPRRPVFMRGARNINIRRYCFTPSGTSPNGWAVAIFKRAVRMARITSFSREEYTTLAEPIRNKLSKRFCLTSAFSDRVDGLWGCDVYIQGREAWDLQPQQISYLKTMMGIIRKTERMDERKALVIAEMQKRLSP